LLENPIAGLPASVAMITKGGFDAITRSLANDYAKKNIRFNAVAPGVVDTPLHKKTPKVMKTLSPMGTISDPKDIAEAVVYLTGSSSCHRGGAARGSMVSIRGSQAGGADRRLQDLGIQLPAAPPPVGTYVETVQTGDLLFFSGMLPVVDHKPKHFAD